MESKKMHAKTRSKVRAFAIGDELPCVWMKAGVINFKLCDNAYDCLTCSFDKAMSARVADHPEKQVSWREVMREKPYNQKECRHMLSGRVAFRLCGNAYNCNNCEFDQMIEDRELAAAVGVPTIRKVSGFAIADDYYYHAGHTWARVEPGGLIRIGVDDFALRLLGYVTEFRLPRLGAHLEQHRPGWTLRREEKLADFLAPLEGIVVAVNHRVLDTPDLAKRAPYTEGWLLVVEPRNLKQNVQELLIGDSALSWLTAHVHKLESMISAGEPFPLAATGGEVAEDIYGNVRHLQWDTLVKEFLRP